MEISAYSPDLFYVDTILIDIQPNDIHSPSVTIWTAVRTKAIKKLTHPLFLIFSIAPHQLALSTNTTNRCFPATTQWALAFILKGYLPKPYFNIISVSLKFYPL